MRACTLSLSLACLFPLPQAISVSSSLVGRAQEALVEGVAVKSIVRAVGVTLSGATFFFPPTSLGGDTSSALQRGSS